MATIRTYPTLALLLLLAGVALVPRMTAWGQSAAVTLQTPLATVAVLDVFTPDPDALATARAELETAQQELAVTRLALAEANRALAQFDRLAATREPGAPALEAVDARVVLSEDASPWRKSLVIDRGSQHGVRLGDPVVAGRVLVGRIAAAGPVTSRVQLLTDPGMRAVKIIVLPSDGLAGPAAVADETALAGYPRGIATGSNRSSFAVELDFVALDAKLRPGDLVFTSNHSAIVPGGLVVGRVTAVNRSQRREFASVTVEPWANPARLERVQVIRWHVDVDSLGEP